MRRLPLFVVLLALLFGASRAQAKSEASDGTPFPAPADRKFEVDLPLIGKLLNGAPDDIIGATEILAGAKSSTRIYNVSNRLRATDQGYSKLVNPTRNSLGDGYAYFAFDVFNAAFMGFNLDNGRISRVGLYYAEVSDDEINTLFNKLRPITTNLIEDVPPIRRYFMSRASYLMDVKSVASARAFLSIKKPTPLTITCTVWRRVSPTGRRRFDSKDVCIVYEVDPIDQEMLYHPDTPANIRKAMIDRKVLVGMTAKQADIALRDQMRYATPRLIDVAEYSEHWHGPRVSLRVTLENDKVTAVKTFDKDSNDAPNIGNTSTSSGNE